MHSSTGHLRSGRYRDAGIVEADAAAGGAGDTVFVDLADGLGPSTAL